MTSSIHQKLQSTSLADIAFFVFIILLPNMIVLNLPQFNLKIVGIGMGAFFIYVSGFMLFIIKIHQATRRILVINRCLLCLLALLFLLFLKQVQSDQSFDRFLVQFSPYMLMALFFLLGLVFIKDEKKRRSLVKVLVINTIAGALIGLIHFYFFPSFQLYDSTANEDEFFSVIDYETMKVRESSTYSTPVAFSHNMAFGILFLLLMLKYRQFKTNKALILLSLAVALLGAYVSYSRAALLFICLFTLYSFVDRKKGVFKYLMFSALTLVVAAIYAASSVAGRFSLSAENVTGEIRWLKWYIALREIFGSIGNFLFGVDIGKEVTMDGIYFSDNYYIMHQLRFGLVGVVVLFVAVRYIYKKLNALLNSQLTEFDAYYTRAVCAIGCASLFFAFFSNILLMVPTNIYLPVLMGSLWNIKKVSYS